MSDEILGYAESPTPLVQAAFEAIAKQSMHDLSFLHPNMPVYVSGFTLFEGQWVGCAVTRLDAERADFPRTRPDLAKA